jgi:hypothetical protein
MLLALLLAAAAPGRFRVEPLSVAGDVVTVVPADLDGDGRKDLLASFTTGVPPYQRRFLAVFWNREGVFAPRPDLVLPVTDDEVCAFDVGAVGTGRADSLLFLTPHGISAMDFPGRAAAPLRSLIEQPTLFHQPIPGELPRVHLVHDIASPQSHDLLVPALGALWIWKRGPAGQYVKAAQVEVDMDAGIRGGGRRASHAQGSIPPIGVTYGFPALHLADTDGDGLIDILATQEDRVAIYRQGPGMSFHPQPDFTRDFAIRSEEEHREKQSNASVLVGDLDGDGVADLVVRKQVFEGIASATSSMFIYFGKKGGGYAREPAQVLKSEGVGPLEVQLLDVTGDGRPDLIVPSMNFGVLAFIRVLTTKTVKVVFQVIPFLPEQRRFADEPLAERELKFRLSLSGDADLQAVDFSGDYDGDKRPDLLFGTGEEELSVFLSRGASAVVADEAAEKIDVRAMGVVQPVDLDGKGRSDVLLHFPSTRGHRGEIVVLVNAGPW